MSGTKALVCPNCGSDDLRSNETAIISYSIKAYLTPETDDEPQWDYTGEHYEVFDEGSVFENKIQCKPCLWEGGVASLRTLRESAHRNTPLGELMKVEEDSNRGSDVRWQAVCWAVHTVGDESYECGWCGPWRHADYYVDEARRLNEPDGDHAVRRPGGEVDPGQLAYEAAERDGQEHLHDEGVRLDDECPDCSPEPDAPDCSKCGASNAGAREHPHLCDVCAVPEGESTSD